VQSYIQTGSSFTTREIFYAAWVKRQPIPYHPFEFATTTDDPINIKYRAFETVSSEGIVNWASSCCSILDQSHTTSSTKHIAGGDNKLYIAIGNYDYGFSLTLIDSHRMGQEFSSEDKYDPIEGHTHTESMIDLDDDTHLGMNVQDANWDTTYTKLETDPSAGETMVKSVTQSFSWDNEKCKLSYSSHYTDTQDQNLFGVQINNVTVQDMDVTFWMSYTGDNPSGINEDSGIKDGILYQNSPNPCSSATRIRYSVGSAQHVTLKILDMYGSEIEILADNEQQAGFHEVFCDVSRLPAGTYFYRFESGNTVEMRKIIVVR
jgi:hypothetical protein